MTLKNIFFFFPILLIVSCRTKQENKKVMESEKSKIEKKIIDTSTYSHLPYWTDSIDRFSEAYIDTFSVGENKFRFVNPFNTNRTGGNSITLQNYINNKWSKTKLVLEDNMHGGDFYHDRDINGDGYIDIANYIRYTQAVYFYDPQINSFKDSAAKEELNPDWFLIDKAKNIYCDFQEYKGLCDHIHSTLYTYKGFKKILLFDLTLYNCSETNNETNLITKLILSKYLPQNTDSLKLIEEIKLDKPIDTDKGELLKQYSDSSYYFFDYREFWKDRYKKLIGSS